LAAALSATLWKIARRNGIAPVVNPLPPMSRRDKRIDADMNKEQHDSR